MAAATRPVPGQAVLQLDLPPAVYPYLIGRQGHRKQELEKKYSVRLLIPSVTSSEAAHVQGPAEQAMLAKRDIERLHRQQALALTQPAPEPRRFPKGPYTQRLLQECTEVEEKILAVRARIQDLRQQASEAADRTAATQQNQEKRRAEGAALISAREMQSTREAMAADLQRNEATERELLDALQRRVREAELKQARHTQETERLRTEVVAELRQQAEQARQRVQQLRAEHDAVEESRQEYEAEAELRVVCADAQRKGELRAQAAVGASRLRAAGTAGIGEAIDSLSFGLGGAAPPQAAPTVQALAERQGVLREVRGALSAEWRRRISNPPGCAELEAQLEGARRQLEVAKEVQRGLERRTQDLRTLREANRELHGQQLDQQVAITLSRQQARGMAAEPGGRHSLQSERARREEELRGECAALRRALGALRHSAAAVCRAAAPPPAPSRCTADSALRSVLLQLDSLAGEG